jgi:transcriptional regulator with XRE-family HTH domain
MHPTYLGQIERGERNPSLFIIVRLADAFDLDPGVLLSGMHSRRVAETGTHAP